MDAMQSFLNEATVDGKHSIVSFARKVTDKKDDVTVTFKKEVQEPVRIESLARCHQFHDVEALGDYLKKYGSKNTVVLCDVNNMKIECILDETVKNGFEVIVMAPKYHPLVIPFTQMATTFQMKDFAAWIMRNRRLIIEPNGRDLAMLLSQIRVSKNITIEAGAGKKSINGIILEMEIASSKKTELVELPEELRIQIPMFVGREEVMFTVDLAVDCNRDHTVIATISSPDFEIVKIKEFDDMLEELKGNLPDGCIVGLGVVDTEEWNYINERKD